MGANLEYQLQNLTGGMNSLGQGFAASGNVGKHGNVAASSIPALPDRVKYWGGLALLVSLGVIGIPFLIYFIIGAIAVVLG
jgi:hypothetical protein